jgi:hypothetical protein
MSLGRSLVLAYNGLRDPFYAKFSVAWICDPCVTESGDRPCANQWSSTLIPPAPCSRQRQAVVVFRKSRIFRFVKQTTNKWKK